MDPSLDSSGPWRLRLESPILNMFHVILVVTIASREGAIPKSFRWNLSRSATNFFFEHRDFAMDAWSVKKIYLDYSCLVGCVLKISNGVTTTGRDLVIQIEYLGEEDMFIYYVYIRSLYIHIHIQMISHILSVWTAEIILTSIRAELFPLTPTTFFLWFWSGIVKGVLRDVVGFLKPHCLFHPKPFLDRFDWTVAHFARTLDIPEISSYLSSLNLIIDIIKNIQIPRTWPLDNYQQTIFPGHNRLVGSGLGARVILKFSRLMR